MSKKLITAALALVALAAFALPAVASATNDPDLTCDQGSNTLCPAGTKITATNVGNVKLTNSTGGVLSECSVGIMTGTIDKNSGTEVLGTIESTTFAGTGPLRGEHTECTGTFGNLNVDTNIGNGTPWCIESGPTDATDALRVRGGACTTETRSITFVLTSTTAGACKYNRTAAIPGTYTTEPEDAKISISSAEFTKHEGGILCPNTGFIDMTMTLETDTATTSPLGIS